MPISILRKFAAAFLCTTFLAAAPLPEPAPVSAPTPAPAPVRAPLVERWIFAKMGALVVGYNEETRLAVAGEVFAHVFVRLSRPGTMSGITYQVALFKGTYNCAARTYLRQSLQVFDLGGISVGAGADVDQAGRPVADDPIQRFFLGVFCGETLLMEPQVASSFAALVEAANRLATE
jgi:hypothetical protein